MMRIKIIAAMASNRAIGMKNALPWHLPSDLKRFKEHTMGQPMLMGRKTFESFGGRALPRRNHIVVSNSKTISIDPKDTDRVFVVPNIQEGLECAEKLSQTVYVIGGQTIYQQMIEVAHSMVLTELEAAYEGDAFFPEFGSNWKMTSEEIPEAPELPYVIRNYTRG